MLLQLRENHQIVIEHQLIVNDERGYREYILSHSNYSIGKAPRADIRLSTQSPVVAPHHATLMLLRENGTSSYQLVKEEHEGVLHQQGLLVNGNQIRIYSVQCPVWDCVPNGENSPMPQADGTSLSPVCQTQTKNTH